MIFCIVRGTLIASGLVAAVLASGSAHAVLQGRDLNGSADSFEAYYDTDLNITWLANANMNGPMDWATANTWAANLSIVDTVNNINYDNWRLPTTLQPDTSCGDQSGGYSSGLDCTGSEMGHLFYNELGGTAGQSILASADPDLAKFTNLQANFDHYWSATEYAPDTDGAWVFEFTHGGQFALGKHGGLYALAVSPGDVAAVPEAETYALMLAGLGLIGWRAWRRG
ncbi:MAG: PEP-CTERM sorting domain-containing protein [Thiobacillus sp.]